jgi:hypothetical protein
MMYVSVALVVFMAAKTLKISLTELDTIIAALRLWQRSPAYPEIEIAEEHGEMLSDDAIDALIERINV